MHFINPPFYFLDPPMKSTAPHETTKNWESECYYYTTAINLAEVNEQLAEIRLWQC